MWCPAVLGRWVTRRGRFMADMQTAIEVDTAQLVPLLEKQRSVFGRLRFLADRQNALVVQDDTRPLIALLAERQHLVDELVGINEQLAPYRRQWTTIYTALREPARRHVAELLEEANGSLSSIVQCDSRDTATLNARRQDLAGRLCAAQNKAAAGAAYVAAGTSRRGAATDVRA